VTRLTGVLGGLSSTLPVAPQLLAQNAVPLIFGDGAPNLMLQGSARGADIPPIRLTGRLAVSYEGTAVSRSEQTPNTANLRSSAPLPAAAFEDVDEAFFLSFLD
jgi:hypothetical protein